MITELDCLEQKEGNAGNVAPGDAPRWGVTSWVSDSKTALDIDRGEELVQGKDRERMWEIPPLRVVHNPNKVRYPINGKTLLG